MCSYEVTLLLLPARGLGSEPSREQGRHAGMSCTRIVMTGREPPIMMPRLPRVRSDTGGAIAAEGYRMRHVASTGPHHTEVCRAPRPQRRSGHVGRTDRTHLAGRLGEQPDLRTLRHALPAPHRLQRGTDAGRRPCSLTLLTRRSTLGVAPPPLLEATTAWHAPLCALCAPACCGVLPWRAPPWTLAPPQDAGVLFRGARDGEKERAGKPTRRGQSTLQQNRIRGRPCWQRLSGAPFTTRGVCPARE